MELHEQLDGVADRASCLASVRAFAEDRAAASRAEFANSASSYGSAPDGWENASIESFFEAAVAWAEDSKFGASQGLGGANVWRQFAVFLYAGKIYE